MKKNIIITGSASGIGLGISKYFEEKGHNVYGLDLDKNSEFRNSFQGDITNESFVKKVFEFIPGKIDALINNAAMQIEKPFFETSNEEWNRIFEVNVFGAFLVTKIFLPKIINNGSIVNISSVHSRATSQGMCAYVASKAALSGMTRSMALELGERGIRVNSIIPGAVDTPMLKKGLSRNQNPQEALLKLKKSSPLNKIGSTVEIAKMTEFLIDHELSGNITGSEFVCDSGVLAKLASE